MKYFSFLVIVFFSAIVFDAQAGSAFAEKPIVPAEFSKSYLAISINKAVIPDAAQVGVPVYPGAKIITSFKGVQTAEGKYKRLPFLELVSVADYDHVVNFYKDKLAGWTLGGFNTALYFAEKGEVDMFSPKTTHVGVHDVLNYYRENEQRDLQRIVPDSKTLIKIFYTVE